MALYGQGRLGQARDALCTYLEKQRLIDSDGQWYVGQAEALLGCLLRELGRTQEATELGRTAVEHTRVSLRPRHPRIADVLEPLSETLLRCGDLEGAEAACQEALEIRRACIPESAAPIATLRLIEAEIRKAGGQDALAQTLAEQALADCEAVYPAGHPEVARAYHVLAMCSTASVESDVQEGLWRSALDRRMAALGSAHPDTARTQIELARFLLGSERIDEADSALRKALLSLESCVSDDHPLVAEARRLLKECEADRR